MKWIFSELIQTQFDDCFSLNGKDYTSAYWQEKAQKRKALVNTFLWNEAQGMYFDYNFKKREQTHFVSATLFTPLWAGMASKEQAEKVVEKALPLLMEKGESHPVPWKAEVPFLRNALKNNGIIPMAGHHTK